MKTHDHDNAQSARRCPVAQRQLLGAAFGPVAPREPQGLEEELPVQGKAITRFGVLPFACQRPTP